ncbi:MAG TPA: hypothetical protein VHB27_14160 [Rhodopila sp.]|uniref:hypothetical protein n=1 Tax=Rhodopila sp. TaxID=2480087 RepID=UPI002BDEEE76|nr:hypothetical protein [Rhodopila sp.]HVY16365.1 hypothetical protein [Rhodopila sp.]
MSKKSLARLLPSLIVVAVAVATLASGMSALSAWRAASAPQIGDMISFRPGVSGSPGLRLDVARRQGGTCVLDLGMLSGSGGSFIVEGPAPDGRYLVHWAGPRTSQGASNCGASAEIVLDARQVELLGIAATASVVPVQASA